MNYWAIRVVQLVALVAAVGWAGPPVADWIDREIGSGQAKRAWQQMRQGDPSLFKERKIVAEFWLKIPSVDIDTLVIAAESEEQLKRHAGCVRSGEVTVISGHRDLHFRPLKDLTEGAEVELEDTGGNRITYRISGNEIVAANELAGHIESGQKRGGLALVTCYPFYFVGEAPQRFVAWAGPQRSAAID